MGIEIVTTLNEEMKETGFGTLKACTNVLDSIKKMGHKVTLNVCKTKEDLNEIIKRKPNLVVSAVKYLSLENKDDIWLAEYFETNAINYIGSSRSVLNFDSDKVSAKIHLRSKGIKTADFFVATPGLYKSEDDLPIKFPLFLKPMDAANGNGVDDLSFVTNFIEFENKVLSLYDLYNLPVLVEEYLGGREFTVAVIKTLNDGLIVSAIEILPPKSENGLRILGEKVKTDDSEELKKITDYEMKNRIDALAVDVFHQLGVRDFGRIDIKTNTKGHCFFMEANLVPGMTRGSSYFPEACEIENDLNYDKVIELLLEKGLSRVASTPLEKKNSSLNIEMVVTPIEAVSS